MENNNELLKALVKKGGIDLQESYDLIEKSITRYIDAGVSFHVKWSMKACWFGNSYPVLEMFWKHDADSATDVFDKGKRLDVGAVMNTIKKDVMTAYKSRQYKQDEFTERALGNLVITCLFEDARTEIPMYFVPTPSMLYYKYITCKDESYKEEFEEVFNEH